MAAALTGLTVATLAGQSTGRVAVLAAVLAVLQVAPIALRQRVPVLALAVIVVAMSAYGLLGYGDVPSNGLGLVIAMFTVATLRTRLVAAAVFVVTLVVTAIVYLTAASDVLWPQLVQGALVLLCAWVLGEGTRRWAQRTERLAAQAVQAVATERIRIARELHDIVAHHMAVISVQAGLAEYVIDADPPTAKSALATVGDASRQALLEMRRLLDVLRVDEDSGKGRDYSPQPGIAQLDDLVRRLRGAGLPVTLAVAGAVRELAPGPDLCAYRMVQESLTNVLKHAGQATARVAVEYGERTLSVSVTDDGIHRPRQDTEGRHGIRGMRERAELYGGVLAAHPAEKRGFTVSLRLPLEERR